MIHSLFLKPLRAGLLMLALGVTCCVQGEVREFTDVQGRKVVAELVSHNGSGMLELKKEGGATFQLEMARFSKEDQLFIEEWIAKTTAKIEYRFEVTAAPDKQAGNRQNFGYKTVKNELWAYKVDIKNVARNTVGGLKVEYRIFVKNGAQGAYASSELGGFHAGAHTLPADLRYNEMTSFITSTVPLDAVNYDTSSSSRFKDALRGLMLRIKDAKGQVVHEYVSPITTLRGKTWDSITKTLEIKSR